MPSALTTALCALAAAALSTVLGAAVGRLVLPRQAPVWSFAPALGWAVFAAVALPVCLIAGFSRASVAALSVTSAIGAAVVLARSRPLRPAGADAGAGPRPPAAVWAAAPLLAAVPAAAVLPKLGADGLSLSAPIFDHAKAALIDAILRLGLPPVDPVFGEVGGHAGVSYYYLWHFTAAAAASVTGASGWEADAALTWFTAWSSLMLMAGLAVWLGRRASAAAWALILAFAGSLRPALEGLFGSDAVAGLLKPAAGFQGWLFQSSWSPQHVQSACCAVLALVLVADLPRSRGPGAGVVLGLAGSAAVLSSLWIGGVVLPAAAAAAMVLALRRADRAVRRRCAIAAALAAACAAAVAAPVMIPQYQASLLREVSAPLAIAPQEVLGPLVGSQLRRILDVPAFWLVCLVVTFPGTYPLGAVVLVRLAGWRAAHGGPAGVIPALAALAAASLAAAWLMASRVGDNNDLGWRAVLPGLLVLTALAAAGLAGGPPRLPRAVRAAAAGLVLISLPHTISTARHALLGYPPSAESAAFGRTVALWEAVRRHAGPADRVANNPLFLFEVTLWPVNLSWALMADRSSCFAGREMALAMAPLSAERRSALEEQFVRVFRGEGTAGDIRDLARRYDCRVAVVTPRDGAWLRDPFAASPDYRLAETEPDRWRIYVRTDGETPAP